MTDNAHCDKCGHAEEDHPSGPCVVCDCSYIEYDPDWRDEG